MKGIQFLMGPKESIDTRCKGAEQSTLTKFSAHCHLHEPKCLHASDNNYFHVKDKEYPVCRAGVELIKERNPYKPL